MSHMKDLDIRLRNGGDDAVAAACELAGLAKERRGYDETMRAGEDITDVVTVLRGIGFSTVSPQAGDSASLLLRVVTAAADEIEHLRNERRWIHVGERLPEHDTNVLVAAKRDGEYVVKEMLFVDWSDPPDPPRPEWSDDWGGEKFENVTHWMPLPDPPANYPVLS